MPGTPNKPAIEVPGAFDRSLSSGFRSTNWTFVSLMARFKNFGLRGRYEKIDDLRRFRLPIVRLVQLLAGGEHRNVL